MPNCDGSNWQADDNRAMLTLSRATASPAIISQQQSKLPGSPGPAERSGLREDGINIEGPIIFGPFDSGQTTRRSSRCRSYEHAGRSSWLPPDTGATFSNFTILKYLENRASVRTCAHF